MGDEEREEWEVILEDLVDELDLEEIDVDVVEVLDEVIRAGQSVLKGLTGDAKLIGVGVILLLTILRAVAKSIKKNQSG